jgi:hypothetical protein
MTGPPEHRNLSAVYAELPAVVRAAVPKQDGMTHGVVGGLVVLAIITGLVLLVVQPQY